MFLLYFGKFILLQIFFIKAHSPKSEPTKQQIFHDCKRNYNLLKNFSKRETVEATIKDEISSCLKDLSGMIKEMVFILSKIENELIYIGTDPSEKEFENYNPNNLTMLYCKFDLCIKRCCNIFAREIRKDLIDIFSAEEIQEIE